LERNATRSGQSRASAQRSAGAVVCLKASGVTTAFAGGMASPIVERFPATIAAVAEPTKFMDM
jgi:hypothetical protein